MLQAHNITPVNTVVQILSLSREGLSSRQIALKVFGSKTKKSTVNDVIARAKEGHYDNVNNLAQPKILLIDIETSAAMVGAFQRWNINVSQAQVFQEVMLLGFVAKWLGSDDLIEVYPTRFSKWNTEREQKQMLQKAWQLLDQADFIIGHNSKKFDLPFINACLVQHGITKPSPYRQIDTLKIARQNFKFPSNSLDSLGEFLGLGRKLQNSGFNLWRNCMLGNESSFKEMIEYNTQDVLLLEQVYLKLRAWDSTHPNVSFHYEDDGDLRCGICGSSELENTGKHAYTATGEYSLYKCSSCGGWHRSRKGNKRESETLAGVK